MSERQRHYYTPDQATALIPQLNAWLHEMRLLQHELDRRNQRLVELLDDCGDQGGPRVIQHVKDLVRWHELIGEFQQRGLTLRDLETGKVEFPARRGQRNIALLWQEGETRVDNWKELSSG